jgi:hypothetical protein
MIYQLLNDIGGRDRMAVVSATTYISTKVLFPIHGKVFSIQQYVIKFVSGLR